jgi:hypothetical protein
VHIVLGVYRFGRKRNGYRAAYCNTCERSQLTHRFLYFAMGYVYWIPLLPLGFWNDWRCAACGKDPAIQYPARRGFVLALALPLGIFAVPMAIVGIAGLADAVVHRSSDSLLMGLMCLAFSALGGALVYAYRRMKPRLSAAQQRALSVPTSDTNCALCSGELHVGAGTAMTCIQCAAERLG